MSETRSNGSTGEDGVATSNRNHRGRPVVVDLERLEEQAEELFLHRFVEYVKKARGEHGRYLTLRTGDALAIRAADDGSSDVLDGIVVEPKLDA